MKIKKLSKQVQDTSGKVSIKVSISPRVTLNMRLTPPCFTVGMLWVLPGTGVFKFRWHFHCTQLNVIQLIMSFLMGTGCTRTNLQQGEQILTQSQLYIYNVYICHDVHFWLSISVPGCTVVKCGIYWTHKILELYKSHWRLDIII